MQATTDFYREIKPFRARRDIAQGENFRPLPIDWTIIVIDIRGSTKAIEEGRYRDVNTVGASAIMAAINALKGLEFPYVFGGDGATLIVPNDRVDDLRPVLGAVREMARTGFNFELRVALVPAADVAHLGQPMLVGRHAISPHLALAVLNGTGFTQAETWAKDVAKAGEYLLPEGASDGGSANYDGLECRWNPLDSQRGEYLSILVKARSADPIETARVYGEIVEEVELLFGGDADKLNPASLGKLSVALSPWKLVSELRVRTQGASFVAKLVYFLKLLAYAVYGVLVFHLGVKSKKVDWIKYRQELIENSDFWKYDDMLRCVIDVSPVQKRALSSLLEGRSLKGEIAYGIHSSKSAIMTCLVFERKGKHVHFVDGDDGGYARAAKMLKERLRSA